MTIEQQRAIAVANARLRLQQQPAPVAPSTPAQQPSPTLSQLWKSDIPVPTGFGGTMTVNPAQVGQSVKNMGLEGGGATIGQIAGAPLGVPGVAAGGFVGGGIGNIAAQLTTPGKKFSPGEAVGAAVMGAVPGSSLAKAGVGEVAQQAAKYGIAGLGSKMAQVGIDEKRLPTLAEGAVSSLGAAAGAPISRFLDAGNMVGATDKAAMRGVNREAVKYANELGLTLPPSAVNPNIVNDSLQSLAGKAATAQAAIAKSQPKINDAIARRIYGDNIMSVDAPFSKIALETAKMGPNSVYEKIGSSNPAAQTLLEKFKQSDAEAKDLFAAYAGSKTKLPSDLAAAKLKQSEAEMYMASLKQVLPKPVFDQFDGARIKLAQIGLAQRAVNKGSTNIDPAVIGQALDNGEPLTDEFLKIGMVENAFGKYVKDAADSLPSGVDYLRLAGKLGAAGAALYRGDPGLAAAIPAVSMAAERGAKSLILSPGYQKRLAQPFYGATTEDIPAGIARLGAAKEARDAKTTGKDNAFQVLGKVGLAKGEQPLTEDEYRKYNELKTKLGK